MPSVSILMSTFNNADYLKRAIDSVLTQSYSDFEFIIINDNSSDATDEIVSDYNDARIIYLKNSENNGLISNLNRGLEMAKGEFIARIDSDDWWTDKDKLKKQVDYLVKNSGCALVGTWAMVYDTNLKKIFEMVYPTDNKHLKKMMLLRNCFVHSSVVFRKAAANACGNYDEKEKYVEDYGLWLRIGENYLVANIPEYCVGYLLNEVGETQKNNLRQIEGVLRLIKKHKGSYSGHFAAKVRWIFKYCLVYCGGLSFVNALKKF